MWKQHIRKQPADEENQAEADQTEEPAAEEIHEEKHSPFSKLTKLITPKKEKKSSGWPQDFQADQASGGY